MQSKNGPDEEDKSQHGKQRVRPAKVGKSAHSGSAVNSTRGDAHSVSNRSSEKAKARARLADSTPAQDQPGETSASEGQSGFGDINKTIEEEDSEYSQSQIGSLVSYTINYMEKKSVRGLGGQSSRHDGDGRGGAGHSDSDEDDDNSLLAEKEEDSHSDIDTIEEEVDLSSEGSDHEEQAPEEELAHLKQEAKAQSGLAQAESAPKPSAAVEVLSSHDLLSSEKAVDGRVRAALALHGASVDSSLKPVAASR